MEQEKPTTLDCGPRTICKRHIIAMVADDVLGQSIESEVRTSSGMFLKKALIWEASFSCPSWFSSGARNLIKRILDLNPLTRITIPEILQDEWFKKGYKPPKFEQDEDL
ncbi:hypothetical protein PVK06_016528 [Gossypium arboreum]|uniref:Uncharacterized protein n=1 Tax=Gossypium arboreum TaxID=29729 RepID=A0ABR0Q080_GOSAR|nr:hypothetical protein PVK06_016528 [Gossypium arboreum]